MPDEAVAERIFDRLGTPVYRTDLVARRGQRRRVASAYKSKTYYKNFFVFVKLYILLNRKTLM